MIELDGYPELVDPLLIAAFEGWNDAGDAATSAVEHLEEVWATQPLTEMDPEDYYDYQVNRPTVSMSEEGRRLVTWPTTRVSFARLPDVGRDVVLIRGIEPNMRWKQYTHEILGVLPRARRRHGRDAGRTARGLAAHQAGAGDRHLLGRGRRRGRCTWSPRGTRGRPASSGWCRTPARAPACRPCRSGRRSPTTSPSRPAPRRRWRCCATSRTCSTCRSRWASCPRTPAPGSAVSTSWPPRTPRSPSTSARWRRPRTSPTLPEASGDAIAREFERYLRRKGDDPR